LEGSRNGVRSSGEHDRDYVSEVLGVNPAGTGGEGGKKQKLPEMLPVSGGQVLLGEGRPVERKYSDGKLPEGETETYSGDHALKTLGRGIIPFSDSNTPNLEQTRRKKGIKEQGNGGSKET